MGPLRLIDEIGVDITVDIANTLEKAYGERDRASKILLQMRDAEIARPQIRQRLLQIRRQDSNRLTSSWMDGAIRESSAL